eukprot:Plantae.Rhodophyta-Purpureofilum_apyrenoidigerum.ctg5518.p1 GENE.Plantae.Rhodophyta-Purpureofilum_apyrenoidigerum.ctg5518~~Plantae.Rhodophyta-Purpureofilum_apyrenoidigerum.ctg5518.p1  ORF type:complete len:471 (-),score=118.83 Plantae.Rhodophyta-Purpureofilum_apyrenoidigerum.ctg5518:647-2059(-)
MERMEALLLKWLDPENKTLSRDEDGKVAISELAAMRKSRRMGYSEDMILKVAQESKNLETTGNTVRIRPANARSQEIQKLLEFWFGDANIRRDKFLSRNLRESEDVMVPLDTLLTFNKLKRLETSAEELLAAIKALSSLLKLSEDQTRVGRRDPLPEGNLPEEDVDARTVYLEPVPADVSQEIVARIVEKYGKVGYISIPRYGNGDAKGFAFVEFDSEQAVAKCLEDFQSIQDAHGNLRIISKQEWLQMKKKFKEQKREHKERAKHAKQIANIGYSVGILVKIMGLSDVVRRQEIYDALETLSPVAYVEFKRKTPEICFARFFTASTAEKAAQALNDGQLKIAGRKVIARVLCGREEGEKWDQILAETDRKKRSEAGKKTDEDAAKKTDEDAAKKTDKDTAKKTDEDAGKDGQDAHTSTANPRGDSNLSCECTREQALSKGGEKRPRVSEAGCDVGQSRKAKIKKSKSSP